MNALVAGAVALSESRILVNGMSATDLITGAHVTGEGELVAEPHEVRYRGSPVSVDALTVLRGLVGDLLEQRREFDARQDPNVPVTSVFAPARSGPVERCPWGLGAAVPDVVVVGPYADVVADHLRVTGLRARTVDLAACLRIAAELAEVERELEALAGHPARVGRGAVTGVDGTAAGAAAPAGASGVDGAAGVDGVEDAADGAAGVDGVDDAAAGADAAEAADGTERERSRGDTRRTGARAWNVVAHVVSRTRTGTPVHGRAGMVGTVARPALAVAVAVCVGVVVAAVWSVRGGDGASSPTGVAATATTTGTGMSGAGRSSAAGSTTTPTTASPPGSGTPGPAAAGGSTGTTGVTARSEMPVDVTVPGWRLTDVAGRRETWVSDDPGMRVIVAATNVPVRSQDALDTAVLDALAAESDLTVTGTGPVRYEERFPGSLTAWTVRFIDGAQVSVGCQYREATEERRRACEAVTWTVAKR
ncbi:type VII secretion-associated protein [Corynebacterium bovis]|uniref:type VII secretion-associated protein n=1 Tax=Corynebacterium bovis TaxID=36808 RepID=UPI00244D1AD7|nr:type VII secretion-associated protein [Corynebacterium bovis]MDH2455634.1 type VII secretion-associated protein [Corynebacterium bovis]